MFNLVYFRFMTNICSGSSTLDDDDDDDNLLAHLSLFPGRALTVDIVDCSSPADSFARTSWLRNRLPSALKILQSIVASVGCVKVS